MEKEIRNSRPTKQGVVVSAGKMNKTVVVAVVENKKHPIYKKVVKSTKNIKFTMKKTFAEWATLLKLWKLVH